MPTDLPKNFSGSGTLEPDRKAMRKAARKLAGRSLWAIAKGLMLHYGVSLAGVAVIAASGFHGVWRAALSATALGLLARWFLPNGARTLAQQAQRRQPQMEVMELTPDQLSGFFKNLGEQADLSEYDTPAPKISPYL